MSTDDERLASLLADRAFACRATDSRHTCMYCNKGWNLNDPGFVYWRSFGEHNWLVRAGIARAGDPMNVVDASTGKPISGGWDQLGWFARCVDRKACSRRRRNLHNGVQHEHLSLIDEIEHTQGALRLAAQAMK